MRHSITKLHQAARETLDFLVLAGELDRFRRSAISQQFSEIRALLAAPTWRRQTYSLAIILLYGTHERFICELCIQIAELYRRLYSRYEDLPVAVKKNHFQLTAEKLTKLDDHTRASYISRLHACLQGAVDLNLDVFAHHTANFRSSVIIENLSRLGITFSQPDVLDRLDVTIDDGRLAGIYATVKDVVDDLANRRNDIAHGNDVDVLEPQTIAAIAHRVYQYDVSLANLVGGFLLGDLVMRSGNLVGSVDRTWKDSNTGIRSLAGVAEVFASIETQSPCWILSNGNEPVKHAIVGRIEKNRIEIDRVAAGMQEICVSLGTEIKESNRLYTLHGRWSAPSAELYSLMHEQCNPEVVDALNRLAS